MSRRLLALVLFAAFASCRAQAGLLSLNFSGVTGSDSSLNGSPIDPGTAFEVHATFDSTPIEVDTGSGDYLPTEIVAVVGGTSYSASFSPGDFLIELDDPTADVLGPLYFAVLFNSIDFSAFAPAYLTATPALDGTAATPAVFSDSLGSLGAELLFSTAAGDLVLTYDDSDTEIAASITAVPEPASLGLVVMGIGGVALIRSSRRRMSIIG